MLMIIAALSGLAIPSIGAQMVHQVTVGFNGSLTYDPLTVAAEVGDVVQFNFAAKNHTATQSSFAAPCTKLDSALAFDSGFKPVMANSSDVVTSAFTVQDKNPVWIYCRQTGHCGKGMVFAVNPPASGNTFEKFQAAAFAIGAAATSTTSAPPTSTTVSTASYTTPPPPPSVVTVTQTITLGAETWTTTYGSYPGSPEATPNPQPVTHNVTVGAGGQLVFNPSNITAKPRDIISFQFGGNVHTATQSSFLSPCRPLNETSTSTQVGFDSGFAASAAPSTFNVVVNDTAPIWVYCRQVGHCGKGMVFSVNAVESGPNNFAAFQALAIRINGTATATASGTTSAASSTGTGQPNSASARSLATGALSGIGALAGIFLFFF